MIRFPLAKINLGLRVGHLRADGYHEIETLLYPLPWYDVLEWVPAEQMSLEVTGDALHTEKGTTLSPKDNLVYKAYELMAQAHKLPSLRIHLHKLIPSGAGLGGGSSDAAQMLLSLNEGFNLGATPAEMQSYAVQLGSDVAFFLQNGPQLARGRGEVLGPFRSLLEGMYIRVLVPQIHVDTTTAYASLGSLRLGGLTLAERLSSSREEWRNLVVNDFQVPLLSRYPLVRALEDTLVKAGAVYTSLSGSGAAIYGLFTSAPRSRPPEEIKSLTTIL